MTFQVMGLGRIRKPLDTHMKEVIKGASVAFLLKVLSAAFAFLFNVIIARKLGADGSGVFFLAFTIVTVASTLGRFGLDNTLLRFVASHASTGEWSSVSGAVRKGIALATAISAVFTALIYLSAPLIAEKVFAKPELAEALSLMALSIIPVTLFTLYAEMIKGLKRVRDAVFIQGLAVWGLSMAGVVLLAGRFGINGAVAAYIGAASITALAGFFIWRVATPQGCRVAGVFRTAVLLKSCVPLFWGSLFGLAVNWAGVILLGSFGTSEDVGIFSSASRTSMLISFILIAVNSIAAPKFAELYHNGDMHSLNSLAQGAARILTLLATPVLIGVFLFSSQIMGIFGDEFKTGWLVLIILSTGQFVNVVTGSVGYLLMMSGNEGLLRNSVAFSAVLTIVLGFLLIPPYGIIGAAVSTSLSIASQNILACRFVYKSIGINTVPWTIRSREAK